MVNPPLQQNRPVGARNGTGRRAFDRWFRYPAGFSADTIDAAFDACELAPGGTLVDCFAGVATTGMQAIRNGHTFVGVEGNPLIAELAALKVRAPTVTGAELRDQCRSMIDAMPVGGSGSTDGEHELVARCFDAATLGELAWMRDRIAESDDENSAGYLTWALLGTLRDSAVVKTGWPYQLPSAERRTLVASVSKGINSRCDAIAADLDSWQSTWKPGTIVLGDSRAALTWTEIAVKADGCVTSPPYLNNYDYLDAIRLELYFLGRASRWSDLLGVARSSLVAATTHHSTESGAEAAQDHLDLLGVGERTRELGRLLAAERKRRPRGKEYDRMVISYAGDMAKVLQGLYSVLRPGAKAVFVIGDSAPYGIFVDTPDLISELGQAVGFSEVSRTLLRNRGLRWRTNGSRHQVSLSEKMLVLEAQ